MNDLMRRMMGVLDSILDLPMDDHGNRIIPPGFLHEAREVMSIAEAMV